MNDTPIPPARSALAAPGRSAAEVEFENVAFDATSVGAARAANRPPHQGLAGNLLRHRPRALASRKMSRQGAAFVPVIRARAEALSVDGPEAAA